MSDDDEAQPAATVSLTRVSQVLEVSEERDTIESGLLDLATEYEDGDAPDPMRVGRFRILDKIGAGGMGIVFAAYDDRLDRKVAIKLVLAGDDAGRKANRRLLEEARAMAQLDHPNVATVHEVGQHDDGVYVAMEFIPGVTLRQWLKKENSVFEVLDAFIQAGRGLEAAHASNLVHRDFKPANAMIDEAKRVRVLDFGLAVRRMDVGEALRNTVTPGTFVTISRRPELTRPGGIVGTPAYMPPEVFAGERCGPLGDQFSYAVALWEGLYGERPFKGDSLLALAAGSDEVDPVPRTDPRRGRVPPWLTEVVLRGLSIDPGDRWPSMGAMLAALEAGDPRAGRRRMMMYGLGGAAVVAVVAAVAVGQRVSERQQLDACVAQGSLALGQDAKVQMRKSFAASSQPDASHQLAAAMEGLERYLALWTGAWSDRCHAQVDQTMTADLEARSEVCFALSRARYEATVTVLRRANDAVVRRGGRQARNLSSPAHCVDEEFLRDMVIPDATANASHEQILALQLQLISNLVPEDLGNYDQGLRQATELLEQAEAFEQGAIVAEAHYRVAVFHDKLGHDDDAARHWVASFQSAAKTGADVLAADAAVSLAFVAGIRQNRPMVGNSWIQVADVYLERGKSDHHQTRANYFQAKAIILEGLDRREEALVVHEEGIAWAIEQGGEMDRSVGFGLVNHAALLQDLDRIPQARDDVMRAVPIFEKAFGADHPTTGKVLHILANLERRLKHTSEAEQLFDRTEAIFEDRPFEERWSTMAYLARDRADLYQATGRAEEAVAEHRRSLALVVGAESKEDVISGRWLLADALLQAGQSEEAFAEFTRCMDDLSTHDDPPRTAAYECPLQLGRLLLEREQHEAAARAFERAMEAAHALDPTEADAALVANLGLLRARTASGRPQAREGVRRELAALREQEELPADLEIEVDELLAELDG